MTHFILSICTLSDTNINHVLDYKERPRLTHKNDTSRKTLQMSCFLCIFEQVQLLPLCRERSPAEFQSLSTGRFSGSQTTAARIRSRQSLRSCFITFSQTDQCSLYTQQVYSIQTPSICITSVSAGSTTESSRNLTMTNFSSN